MDEIDIFLFSSPFNANGECLEKYYIIMCRIEYDIENLVDKISKFFGSQTNEENYIIKWYGEKRAREWTKNRLTIFAQR